MSLLNSGFQNTDLERKYATADSTVILSWHLNFRKIKWKEGFTGQLNWKQQESATAYELLDFNVTARGEQHETKKSSRFQFEIRKPESSIELKLPKVHFNHSGQYQCQLAYNRRYVQSKIELVVMKGERRRSGSKDEELQTPGSHKSVGGPIFPSSHSHVLFLPLQSQLTLLGHSPEGPR